MIAETYPLELNRRLERLIRFAFGNVFNRVYQPTFSRVAAVAAPWWLTGGIGAANCIAAYQPKGAASLAASYVNLVTPGTYDAYAGVAPSWDATNGWQGDGTKYLFSDVPALPTTTSFLVRFASVAASGSQGLMGISSGGVFIIFAYIGGNVGVRMGWGARVDTSPNMTSGVYIATPTGGYRDGVVDISGQTSTTASSIAGIAILARRTGAASVDSTMTGNILAAAVYNIDISAYAAALTTAVNAL